MKKIMTYSLRLLGRLILVILLVVLLISLLIQLQPVKNKIADIAGKQVSEMLNGRLTLGKLEGTFFTGLTLEDILIANEADTLAYIYRIQLRYNLLSLFNKTVELHSVSIDRPYLYLEQINDTVWNVQQLMKPSGSDPDTTTSATMNIIFRDFNLQDGRIHIHSPDSLLPERVQDLDIRLSMAYTNENLSADIQQLNLITRRPDFQLSQLTLGIEMSASEFSLSDFVLQTAQNSITGEAKYIDKPVSEGVAQFETGPLHLEEFTYFLQGLQIPAKPVITLNGEIIRDSVYVDLVVSDGNQSITAKVFSGNFYEYLFRDTAIIPEYHLNSEFNNINPAHWSGNPDLNYLLNGNIQVEGQGLEPATADVSVVAKFTESTIEDYKFNGIAAYLALSTGNLQGTLEGNGAFGSFAVRPVIKDLMGDPAYNVSLDARNLNLAIITGTDTLSSDINLSAYLVGQSFDPEKISASADVRVFNSTFQDIHLDTVFAEVHYMHENVRIDSLMLVTQTLNATASGNYSMNDDSDIRLSVVFDGLHEFERFIPATGLSTSGRLDALVSGHPDSLELKAELYLDSTRYDTITFHHLKLLANGRIAGTDTVFDADLFVSQLDLGGFRLDSIQAQVEGSLDSVFLVSQVSNQDLKTHIQAGIVPGDKLKITVPEWSLSYKNQQWNLQQPPAYIEIDSVSYYIDNFRLASGESDSAQFITLQGIVTGNGEQEFMLEAGNILIAQLAQTMDVEFDGSGSIDLNLSLSGTSRQPLLAGDFGVNEAEINQYRFNTFEGSVNYSDERFLFETLIVPEDSGRFQISAEMPLQLNLDTMGFHFSPDDSLTAQVLIEEFSLGILNSFNIPVQTTGFIEGKVDVRGTANSPDPDGNLQLVDASFRMREYGIDYRDVRLNLSFLRDRIQLDTFRIRTSDGNVTGTGLVLFSSDFYEGDITDSKIRLNFSGFNPVNHPQFNMEVEGYAELTGVGDSVVFGGDLRIPQSEFYLPAIFNLMGSMENREIPKPLLVRELETMPGVLDTMQIMKFEKQETDSAEFDYFDQLKGQLRVRIPRNTWIKNDDMRIEISGELEVIKNADFFELFGQVEVVRGQYEMLGRAFVINEGTINFEGGEALNLRMDIEASYNFRNTRKVQQELTVQISGTPEEPEISFQLDGSSIEEGDALSYILFGKGMNELTVNEQDNMESTGIGSLAEQAAASLVSAQLTSFLQNKLNVDYIEVKSGGGFNDASVVVGKYITNNLFVSYEQRFGQSDEQNQKKYEVRLEYELFRFLFFELNNSTIDSGFDVIFKFDVL